MLLWPEQIYEMMQVAESPRRVLITNPEAQAARPEGSFIKQLDYNNRQQKLYLNKAMAHHLLPLQPQSATPAGVR